MPEDHFRLFFYGIFRARYSLSGLYPFRHCEARLYGFARHYADGPANLISEAQMRRLGLLARNEPTPYVNGTLAIIGEAAMERVEMTEDAPRWYQRQYVNTKGRKNGASCTSSFYKMNKSVFDSCSPAEAGVKYLNCWRPE